MTTTTPRTRNILKKCHAPELLEDRERSYTVYSSSFSELPSPPSAWSDSDGLPVCVCVCGGERVFNFSPIACHSMYNVMYLHYLSLSLSLLSPPPHSPSLPPFLYLCCVFIWSTWALTVSGVSHIHVNTHPLTQPPLSTCSSS